MILDGKCSNIDNCHLRHRSIEKHIFSEMRFFTKHMIFSLKFLSSLCYEFDLTIQNVQNMKKLKLDLYR